MQLLKVVVCVAVYTALFRVVSSHNYSDICDSPLLSDDTVRNYCLYDAYSKALTNHAPNLYAMRKAFFYAPTADPVLFKVTYNISYDNDIDLRDLPECPKRKDDQTPYIYKSNQTTYTYGWTSTGVFTIIHPLLLNAMQFQAILFFHKLYDVFSNEGPHVDSLLWDGIRVVDLPKIDLKLFVGTLPCVPSEHQLRETFKEITSQLKIYAGNHFEGADSNSKENLGFTIESENTAINNNILHSTSSKAIFYYYIAYTLFAFGILLAVLIVTFWKRKDEMKNVIDRIISTHRPLYSSTIVVSAITIAMLCLFDVTALIYWCCALRHNRNNIAPVLFLHSITLFKKGVIAGTTLSLKKYTIKDKNAGPDSEWTRLHTTTIIVLFTAASLFLDHAMPSFLYIMAYPIDVAAIFAYTVVMYISVNTIMAAVMKVSFNNLNSKILWIMGGLILFLSLAFYLFGQWLIYLLAVGKTAVISIGPLTIISLLPSLGIGVITWFIKQKVFNEKDENESRGGRHGGGGGGDGGDGGGGGGDGGGGEGGGGGGGGGSGGGDGGGGGGDGGVGGGGGGSGDGGSGGEGGGEGGGGSGGGGDDSGRGGGGGGSGGGGGGGGGGGDGGGGGGDGGVGGGGGGGGDGGGGGEGGGGSGGGEGGSGRGGGEGGSGRGGGGGGSGGGGGGGGGGSGGGGDGGVGGGGGEGGDGGGGGEGGGEGGGGSGGGGGGSGGGGGGGGGGGDATKNCWKRMKEWCGKKQNTDDPLLVDDP